jgi:hypothetical protein
MRNLIRGIVAFVGLATVSFSITTPVDAEASGDGFRGPIVVTDAVLNQSLQALNAFMVGRYAQDDKLAAITAPVAKEFRTIAVATATMHSMSATPPLPSFGLVVNDDDTLDASMSYFNAERSSLDGDLHFSITEVQVHRALDFTEISNESWPNGVPYSLEVVSPDLGTEFGRPVYDAISLDNHTVALNTHIEQLAAREELLNFNPPPPMTQISFDVYASAMTLSYN